MVDSNIRASHIKTPLLRSAPLSKILGHNVFLKVDSLQPSGSFKIRGVGRAVQAAAVRHGSSLHVVSSSGGNAGLAAATAARIAGVRCTVFCPDSTPDHIVSLLEAENAQVHRHGKAWDEANVRAMKAVEADPHAVLIHPFEGDELIEGHTSIVDEIYDQLAQEHGVHAGPDAVSLAVGGAGLLHGVLRGLERKSQAGYSPPLVIGSQCFGADAFTQSYRRKELVSLDAITSKATSMGALTCSKEALDQAMRYTNLRIIVMDDEIACASVWRLARDHRLLVEIACGAALAPVYFARRLSADLFGTDGTTKNVVIILCGGSKDRLQDIHAYQQRELSSGRQPSGRLDLDGKAM